MYVVYEIKGRENMYDISVLTRILLKTHGKTGNVYYIPKACCRGVSVSQQSNT
jgi:hypothetical protein